MLKLSCRRYQAAFEIDRSADTEGAAASSLARHRQTCAACDKWASRLEAAASSVVSRPMPTALAERLRKIPSRPARCDSHDRLYQAARLSSRGGQPDAGISGHLEDCDACRKLYEVLRAGLVPYRFSLPTALAEQLKQLPRRSHLPRRPQLPQWRRIPDLWQGLAACCLLTLGLMAVVPEFDGSIVNPAQQARSRAAGWAASSSELGARTWNSFSGGLGNAFGYTRQQVTRLSGLGVQVADATGVVPAAEGLIEKIEQTLKKQTANKQTPKKQR